MTSQLVIFRAFLFIFYRSPDHMSEKKIPVNQLIKKSGLKHIVFPLNSIAMQYMHAHYIILHVHECLCFIEFIKQVGENG